MKVRKSFHWHWGNQEEQHWRKPLLMPVALECMVHGKKHRCSLKILPPPAKPTLLPISAIDSIIMPVSSFLLSKIHVSISHLWNTTWVLLQGFGERSLLGFQPLRYRGKHGGETTVLNYLRWSGSFENCLNGVISSFTLILSLDSS